MSYARQVVSAIARTARNADICRVELAWGAAVAAEWAHFVALGVFAYRTGGASAVGLAGLLRLLPAAVITPVAGAVAGRFRQEQYLLAVIGLGVLALAGSAVGAQTGVDGLVFGGAGAVGVSTTLVRPTLLSMLPALARSPEELIAANGASSTIEGLGTLAGPLLAGVLVAFAPVAAVFAVAAAILAGGTVLLTGVRPEPLPAPAGRAWSLRPLLAAWRVTARPPATRLVLALMVVQTFVRGCLNVLIVAAAFGLLHDGAGAVGYLTAAIGAGGLLGALWSMALPHRRLAAVFVVALVLWGLPITLMAAPLGLAVSLVMLAVVGAANSAEDVAGLTLLQRVLPGDSLHGLLAAFWGVAMGAVAAGSITAPHLVSAVGPRWSLLIVGALLPLAAVAAWPAVAGLDRLAAPAAELSLLGRLTMFEPLSLVAKERLAGGLAPISAQAGQTIVRAGERGDRFYIVVAGELGVQANGHRRTLTADDCFGEIALLRAVPRTATVTAITDARLYALERADFLAAVAGHPAAWTAAHAAADAHLTRSEQRTVAPPDPARAAEFDAG